MPCPDFTRVPFTTARGNPRYIQLLTIFLFLITPTGLTAGAPRQIDWKGKITTVDGVSHIHNPDSGCAPELSFAFVLEMEIGLGDDNDCILDQIMSFDVDDSGNVFVLDKSADVKVFSPDGNCTKTIGRSGEGPGEFLNPSAVVLDENQNMLVGASMPARIVMFDADRKFVRNIEFDFLGIILGIKSAGTNDLLLHVTSSDFKGDRQTVEMSYILSVVDYSGTTRSEITRVSTVRNIAAGSVSEKESAGFGWCLDAAGNVYVVRDIYDYNVQVYDLNGKLLKVIARDFTPIKRTDDELARLKRELESYQKKYGINMNVELSPIKPMIGNIFADERNRLWIVTPEGAPDGGMAFDIFDREGRYVVKTTIDNKGTGGFLIKGNRIYFVFQTMDELPRIYRYKITEGR